MISRSFKFLRNTFDLITFGKFSLKIRNTKELTEEHFDTISKCFLYAFKKAGVEATQKNIEFMRAMLISNHSQGTNICNSLKQIDETPIIIDILRAQSENVSYAFARSLNYSTHPITTPNLRDTKFLTICDIAY